MSQRDCMAFLRAVEASPVLALKLGAITAPQEIVHLARSLGHAFSASEFFAACAGMQHAPAALGVPIEPGQSDAAVDPVELPMGALPNGDAVLAAVRALQAAMPLPEGGGSAPEQWPAIRHKLADPFSDPDAAAGPVRTASIFDLDADPGRPGYARYFEAKLELLQLLRGWLGDTARFSGSFLYPPGGWQAWHTNENQPGWRLYLIDPGSRIDGGGDQFFRYRRPDTGEIVTLREDQPIARFFRIEGAGSGVFWHCVANLASAHRWSFGFSIPSDWQRQLAVARAGVPTPRPFVASLGKLTTGETINDVA